MHEVLKGFDNDFSFFSTMESKKSLKHENILISAIQ